MQHHLLLLLLPIIHGSPIVDYQRQLDNLHTLVNDLKVSQSELRQSTNDHTLVNWLKDSVVDLKQELAEAVKNDKNNWSRLKATLATEFELRIENEMRQVRLQLDDLQLHQAKQEADMESFKECMHIDYKVSYLHIYYISTYI